MVLYEHAEKIFKKRGLVAQWTRARGYGPRCRGFESLLARFLFRLSEIKKYAGIAQW
jgi:hypothetical protein